MADTERSLAALQLLLADNTAASITPQQLRDFLVSAMGGYGGLYVDPAAAPQTTNIAPAKLTAWNGSFVASGVTASSVTDDLTLLNAARYRVSVSLSATGSAGQTFTFSVAKNGAAVVGASQSMTGSTSLTALSPIEAIVDCAASDVLSVLVSSGSNTQSVTIANGQFTCKRLS